MTECKIDFNLICRTCLQIIKNNSNNEPINVYDTNLEIKKSFAEILEEIINLKVHLNDDLPKHICYSCTQNIKKLYEFKFQAENSEKILLNYLTKIRNSKEQRNDSTIVARNDYINFNLKNLDLINVNKLLHVEIDVKSESEISTSSTHSSAKDETVDNNIEYQSDDSLRQQSKNANRSIRTKKVAKKKKSCKETSENEDDKSLNHQGTLKSSSLKDKSDDSLRQQNKNSNRNIRTRKIAQKSYKETSESEDDKPLNRQGTLKSPSLEDKSNNKNEEYSCNICQRTFKDKRSFSRHIHDGDIKCEICHKTFIQSGKLKVHMKKFHSDNTRSGPKKLCMICGKSVWALKIHVRRHTGEKPYKCDLCDKAYPRSTDLVCHRRIHLGEKPYLCTVCGKGFRESTKLKNHVRIHTGEKPHKCTYCDKAFIYPKDLKYHIRLHTGEKPYECGECGQNFIQKNVLTTHCKKKGHNLKLFKFMGNPGMP